MLAVTGVCTLAACQSGGGTLTGLPSGEPSPVPSPTGLVDEGYQGRFRTTATVLEADRGPQLCLGGVMESYPPQCRGVVVEGWSWDGLSHESVSGVRWGEYVVVGRYDGTTFTLTEPARERDPQDTATPSPDEFATPCPEPEGGWRPVDPATTTLEALDRATAVAARQNGYGGLWIDQNMPPQAPPDQQNDPQRVVLNVTTTGEIESMEQTVRRVWGGALCVSRAARTEDELQRVQETLSDLPGLLTSSVNARRGWVEVGVVVATTELQGRLDRVYGPGVVRLQGALVAID